MQIRALTFVLCVVCFRLLAEKSTELGEQVNKLCNGLLKISDTREKVEGMTVELEEAKKQVAEFQKQCEDYLTVILEQKREADRHQKVKLHRRGSHVDVWEPKPRRGVWNCRAKSCCVFLVCPLNPGGE